MFCTKCGKKIKGGDNFCAKCGKQVERESVSEQASKGAEGGKSKSRSLVLKITIGVVVVALLVGGWFGWSAYSSFRDKREKRRARHEERLKAEERQRQYEQAKRIYEGVLKGEGSSERINEAVRLATPAAENDETDAQVLLGACYGEMYELEGESEWIANSAKWYLKAARAGNRKAQKLIASYYLEGHGVRKDLEESYKWACKAGIPFENRNIQLEEYSSGIALNLEELPRSQLTIDVEAHGGYKIYGQDMSIAQIQQQVKEHFKKYYVAYGDFPCLIRADKRVMFRHIGKLMIAACQGGLCEAGVGAHSLRLFFVARRGQYKNGDNYTTFSARVLSPFDSPESREAKDDQISIDIGPRGECYLNHGRGMRFSDLDKYIKEQSERAKKPTVFVKCVSETPYGPLVRTLDICNKYGMKNLVVLPLDCGPGMRIDSPNVSPVADTTSEVKFDVEIAEVEEQEELDLEPPPPEVEPPPEDMVDVTLDTPTAAHVAPTDVNAPVSNEPQSFKPAPVNSALLINSPVKLPGVKGVARDAGSIGQKTKGGAIYGDATTERAVSMALRWLKATQITDENSPDYGAWGTKPELGLTNGMDKAAGAGFAVLTFLAHGETPDSPEFGPTVERALNYLIKSVHVVKDKEGKEVVKMTGAGGSEYGFLIGTYALCEAYAMTKNPEAKAAAEKTLRRIIDGQTATGGWNYNMKRTPSEGAPDDISFGGWAMQALKAGKMAGIHLDGMEECIKKAVICLKTRNYSERAGFVYRATTNHKSGGGGLAGVGCLAMQLLGYANDPKVANALNVMKDWQPSLDKEYSYVKSGTRHNPQYYCYYAARCKYFAGLAEKAKPADLTLWKKWNAEMKALYPKAIIKVVGKDGKPYTVKDARGRDREIGHWVNGDTYNYDVMGTCLVALQLMVYYRYLPTSQLKAAKVEVEVQKKVDDAKKKDADIGVETDI